MVSLTVQQLFQLYAPLAGLLAVVFWLGVLSNRVANLEAFKKSQDERNLADATEVASVIRTEEQVKTLFKMVEKMERELAGMQRTLANAFSGKASTITTFGQDGSER